VSVLVHWYTKLKGEGEGVIPLPPLPLLKNLKYEKFSKTKWISLK
jgi:hypothetical protein